MAEENALPLDGFECIKTEKYVLIISLHFYAFQAKIDPPLFWKKYYPHLYEHELRLIHNFRVSNYLSNSEIQQKISYQDYYQKSQ